MKKILKEPLFHFLLIGAGMFVFYGQINESNGDSDNKIVVTTGHIVQFRNIFQKSWQRQPTRQELQGLIDNYLLEEVYYRKAVAMGLDRDDTVIRRRLRQKLEFLTDDAVSLVEPDDNVLQIYLSDNPDMFRTPRVYSFEQAYFNPDRHVPDPEGYVTQQLDALRAGNIEVVDASLLPMTFNQVSAPVINRAFGQDFAAKLNNLNIGVWQGPVRSGLGLHLIRIHKRTPERLPSLAEIRPHVEREWRRAKQLELRKSLNASMLEGYEVLIKWPEGRTEGTQETGGEPLISEVRIQ